MKFTVLTLLALSIVQNALAIDTQKAVHYNTPVKDQGKIGFCWSYTLTGWLENKMKVEQGAELDLSEEYLGFYHLYRQLESYLEFKKVNKDPNNVFSLLSKINFFGIKGVVNLVFEFFVSPKEGNFYSFALDELQNYGMVPESVFNKKFNSIEVRDQFQNRLKAFLNETGQSSDKIDYYLSHPEELRKKAAEIFGSNPIQPDTEFEFDGEFYTPKSFASVYLGFDSSDYSILNVNPKFEDQYQNGTISEKTALRKLKNMFDKKQTVPMGFTVLNDVKKSKKDGIFDRKKCEEGICRVEGGHAVLAVDLESEKNIWSLTIKNSWGAETGNQGYYSISSDYLLGIDDNLSLQIVLPRSVLND